MCDAQSIMKLHQPQTGDVLIVKGLAVGAEESLNGIADVLYQEFGVRVAVIGIPEGQGDVVMLDSNQRKQLIQTLSDVDKQEPCMCAVELCKRDHPGRRY